MHPKVWGGAFACVHVSWAFSFVHVLTHSAVSSAMPYKFTPTLTDCILCFQNVSVPTLYLLYKKTALFISFVPPISSLLPPLPLKTFACLSSIVKIPIDWYLLHLNYVFLTNKANVFHLLEQCFDSVYQGITCSVSRLKENSNFHSRCLFTANMNTFYPFKQRKMEKKFEEVLLLNGISSYSTLLPCYSVGSREQN